MRPVNLIPKDDGKRGGALRSAPIAYLLVGVLALGLGAVTMLVLTNNKIADRKAEIADLNNQVAAVQVQATQLQPFIDFRTAEQQRITEIRDLANSRINWDRIMQELSRVLPSDVSLDSMSASSGEDDPAVAATGGGTSGPTLAMTGCANGHESVAGFLAALKDIDGVTDVDLQSSQRGSGGGAAAGGGGGTDGGCAPSAATFQLTVTLGAAPSAQPADAAATAAAPVGTAPAPADTTNASTVTPAG